MYAQLFNNDVINTITHTLSLLILLCEFLNFEGVKIVYNAAEEYAKTHSSKIFKELVQFINGSIFDIKVNTMTLLSVMLQKSNDSSFQAKLIVHFNEVDLNSILEKNSECNSPEFQIQLTNYQKYSGEVIKGSNFQVEIYKQRLKDSEDYILSFEQKFEFLFLNQNFYEEVVEDFLRYKKIADICSEVGGYYSPATPTERHDSRINQKIPFDKNGLVNLKKITDESRVEDSMKLKKIQNELRVLRHNYKSLQVKLKFM